MAPPTPAPAVPFDQLLTALVPPHPVARLAREPNRLHCASMSGTTSLGRWRADAGARLVSLLLDLGDRLIWMGRIRDQTPPLTIDEEVELLQHGLPDQDLVAEHQGLVEGVSSL